MTHLQTLKDKVLYVNVNNTCYKYAVIDDRMEVSEVLPFYSTHEEAGSKMLFHLNQLRMEK